jgi:hypothetical protein
MFGKGISMKNGIYSFAEHSLAFSFPVFPRRGSVFFKSTGLTFPHKQANYAARFYPNSVFANYDSTI